jgi:antitoxin YefM
MTTIYRLNVNELSQELLNSIKAAYKDKVVEITVTEALDETAYLLSSKENKKHLEQSQYSLEQGKGITFTVQELEEKYGNK